MSLRFDNTLFLLWLAALAVGVVMVTSASLNAANPAPFALATRHGVYVAAGMLSYGVAISLPLKFWFVLHRPLLVLSAGLLVLVLIPGIGLEANGATRWIGLGSFSVQAAEVAKFCMVVYLAGYISRCKGGPGHELDGELSVLARPLVVLAVICSLILIEPDFGSVVVIAAVGGGLLFLGGARLRHFLSVSVAALGLLAIVAVLQPYRLDRIKTFTNPWEFAQDSGYQLTQALIAFGRGEWFGLGLGDGVQKLAYLPEAHNDFIYAVVAEELGLLGTIGVLVLLCLLVLRIFRIAGCSKVPFARYVAYGAGLLIGVQTLINVGVNTGILPTKGLTLPFISYGGNSLVVCCALLGLAQRADMEVRDGRK